ncbi:hypothetical protein HGRIS_004583 [Hohenbuehelia grisea]|uniref:ceramidase n=1 Tax=Hohenbuehelia grisea TaxID=104357 RepID=A0ABR3JD39_9AGAR
MSSTGNHSPPAYQIDLSLPPRERHRHIVVAFKRQLQALIPLYEEILSQTPAPSLCAFLSKHLLRVVHSSEETEEILGISEASGVPRHLVVAYNTFLDLFAGCVSGGVEVGDAGASGKTTGVIHFRGLDWDMEALRDLLICVEFVRKGEVVARTITYAGYTGILTGVRKGLSMSLNYRARFNSPSSTFAHRRHQIALLLGLRPSVASYLRSLLLSPGPATALSSLAESLPSFHTSPCYLTFCSSESVILFEKDLKQAIIRTDSRVGSHAAKGQDEELIVVTNHDVAMQSWSKERWDSALNSGSLRVSGMHDLVKDSVARKSTVLEMWRRAIDSTEGSAKTMEGQQASKPLRLEDVRAWLKQPPVLDESTHFSCIMDPGMEGGGILWSCSYPGASVL